MYDYIQIIIQIYFNKVRKEVNFVLQFHKFLYFKIQITFIIIYYLKERKQMESFKNDRKVASQQVKSESSFSIGSYQESLEAQSFTPSSHIKTKTKFIKKTQRKIQQQKTLKSKKDIKVIHTFVMCIVNEGKKSDCIIETDVVGLKQKNMRINDQELEEKARQMASKHRDSIMNQKYYDLRKNKQGSVKSLSPSYCQMNLEKIYNNQYPVYNVNYMMANMAWQNYYPSISVQRPF